MDDVDLAFEEGLVPVVAQDADSGEVLMLAYANVEALERTRETGLAHYYSRSRDELWQKGATSGHVQQVEEVRVDCDGDALLYLIEQEGGACHTGYRSCFHRRIDDLDVPEDRDIPGAEAATAETTTVGERVFDPNDVYE